MNKSVRVAHICSTFSKLSETFVYDYVTGLEYQNTFGSVVAFKRENAGTRPFPRVHIIDESQKSKFLRIVRTAIFRKRRHETLEMAWTGQRRLLYGVLNRIDPDVIHAHFGPEGVLAMPVSKSLGKPIVVTFYGYDISKLPRNDFWRRHYDSLWLGASRVIVLSECMRSAAVALGCPASKTEVVRLARQFPLDTSMEPKRTVRRLISVGRLVEKKGHEDAIKAIHIARKRFPDLRLEIIGEGPLRGRIEKLIQDINGHAWVSLLGEIDNKDVFVKLQQADAFILCSKTAPDGDMEGTPTVLIEAQFLGLPCISTRHAGIPEMLPSSARARLAPEGDVECLAKEVGWLASASSSKIREIGALGRSYVGRHFELARETAKLVAIYKQPFLFEDARPERTHP
jgi:glycosyltransferase involved in cell wall biosynthesis